MQPGKLIAMANQIAAFFRSYPDAEAIAGVHRHLEAFWTPGMVRTLRQHLTHDTAGVHPLVSAAMRLDPDVASPVDKVLSPVREGGAMATDAG